MASDFSNNDYVIVGTIYGKEHQTIQGKKDPKAVYEKYLVTLEVKKSKEIGSGDHKRYADVTEFPQFEAFGMNLDDFIVGDFVKINFTLTGKKWENKATGKKGIFTKNSIVSVKFADIDTNGN